MTGSEVSAPVSRDVVLGGGEVVDILSDAGRVAEYLERMETTAKAAYREKARVEEAVLDLLDAGTISRLRIDGGELVKDPVDYSDRVWDDQVLARLWDDEHIPADPDLAEAYKQRLIEALRPEYVYRPLVAKLSALAKERPDLAGIIADAEMSKPKRRHVKVVRS